MGYISVLIIFLIIAIFFSGFINGLFFKFSKTLGIRNNGEINRWNTQSKPSLGGISFYIIFLVSIIFLSFYFRTQNIFSFKLFGFILACSIGFLMGLADDAYNTRPLLKFLTQVLCAIILIYTGTSISIFENNLFNYFLTIFWVVGLMNSINMLDNMDAITSIVSSFILMSALVICLIVHPLNNVYNFLIAGVLAALIGFLYYNWNPSKIFMGDTGSQFLGVFLAGIGIIYFWNNNDFGNNDFFTKKLLNAILIFCLPIIDTTIVVINRLSRGKSPFVGGKDHTTHNLYYLGLSERQVAFVFIGLSIISFLFILLINSIYNWELFHFFIFAFYFISLFGTLFIITKIKKKRY